MQPIPQTNTRQNKRERKLNSSRPRHLERSRVSSKSSTGWSPQHILRWKKTRTGWSTRLSILKKALRYATLRLCQRSQLTLPPLNRLTWLTTRSSNDRWEVAADIQTGEQYSSTGSKNAQKHLATIETSRKTLIVFLKMPTLIEAVAAIVLTCFSNVNLESNVLSQSVWLIIASPQKLDWLRFFNRCDFPVACACVSIENYYSYFRDQTSRKCAPGIKDSIWNFSTHFLDIVEDFILLRYSGTG